MYFISYFQLLPTNHNMFAFLFNRFGWHHPNKLMFHGVAREKGWGVPGCLSQQEAKTKKNKALARWTLKVAYLKGDSSVPGMVAFFLYDSKPFYFITNTCDRIKWEKKTKLVFSFSKTQIVTKLVLLWVTTAQATKVPGDNCT